MNYQIISGYSKNTPYEKEVSFLIKSLIKFNICVDHIVGFENQGTWEKNCQYKAIIIRDKLKELNIPIVWLDCDAILEKEPILFDTIKQDIAFCKYKGKLASGTLYLKPSEKIYRLVEDWIKHNSLNPTAWDQKVLQKTIERYNIKYEELPLSYCKVDFFESDEIVIAQNQASRRFKKIINR